MKILALKLLKHLFGILSAVSFISAIIWLVYWGAAWDIQAIHQAEAYSRYAFALIPIGFGALSYWGAHEIEKEIEEECDDEEGGDY